MTVKLRNDEGHATVETIGGTATLAVFRHFGPYCLRAASFVLDPDQVLELATALTQAAVPPPPVVRRRIDVRRYAPDRWVVQCPECFPLPGAFTDHSSAIAAAHRHLDAEHATERVR